MKRRKNLGASEGEHLEQVRHHLEDRRTHVENVKLELAAGDCHAAFLELGHAFRSYGTASGHVQGIPDGKMREKLVTGELVRDLVDTTKARDQVLARCSLRKARGAR